MANDLTDLFEKLWEELKGPPLLKEHPYPGNFTYVSTSKRDKGKVKPYKFKADYYCPETLTIIEIEGGIWLSGRSGHSSGKGILRDCVKTNIASLTGHRLIRLPANLVNKEYLTSLLGYLYPTRQTSA